MNWKVKAVLLFGKLHKPIEPNKDLDVAKMRKQAESAAKLGSYLFNDHIDVATVTDESADGVPLRIYKDSPAKGQRVIIYYHGGGFVLYGLDSHDNVCRRLCKMNNCIVVSVDYRLAPEHTFPAAHEDAFTAIQWVRKHIEEYGGDPSKLVVHGDSAGGNLAACMAHRCKRENIPLQAQVMVYPWIDGKMNNPSIDQNGSGYLLTKEAILWFQQQYTPRTEDHCHPRVSPLYETEFSGLPPALILTAEYDPLLDDGKAYYNKLKESANKVIYREYKQLFHGFFNLPKVSRNAMQAYRDIRDFLKEID